MVEGGLKGGWKMDEGWLESDRRVGERWFERGFAEKGGWKVVEWVGNVEV